MGGQKGVLASALYAVSIAFLLIFVQIDEYPLIIGFFTIAFLAYSYIVFRVSPKFLLVLAFGLRLIAVFSFPGLSDDIYRFLWDGWLITEGVNPYAYLPVDVPLQLGEFQNMLLEKMNSPEYYSVYPSVLQALFTCAAYIIPESLYGQMVFIKLILFAAELGTFILGSKILERMGKDKRLIYLYLLNPLVLVELIGNMHMELLMIFGFAVFLWGLYEKKGLSWSVFGLAFSVASKLVTAITFPFLLKRLTWKELLGYGGMMFLVLGVLFGPMVVGSYENFGKGLDLYFQKFEFNASVYFLVREVGYWVKGYNVIAKAGPFLGVIAGMLVLVLAWKEKDAGIESLCKRVLWALTIYYLLSTTVHPWYTSLLVFLSVFTNIRYAYVWSFLALLSYAEYYGEGNLYYWAVALEYVLLALFVLGVTPKEIFRRKTVFQ